MRHFTSKVVVGVIDLKLALMGARSLKDKRGVIRSLKDKLRNKANLSIAEVDAQEMTQLAVLAIAHVGCDGRHVRRTLDKTVNEVREMVGSQLVDYSVNIFHR